ncbi:MAG: hypothetical protein WC534_01815 [Candidatus Paceibacterota bacterium]
MKFFKKIFSHKTIIAFFCFVFISFLFFPFFASAFELSDLNPFNFLSNVKDSLGEALLGAIFGLLMTVPLYILNVSLDLLTWVASGNFLAVSFTGADNVIVSTGWGFVRNLANVVLIFGLVIIALSIILGYQETRAKKTLVNFILIAALINFTPVFCGLIIDLATMIMDLLLKGGVPPTFVNLLSEKMTTFNSADIPTLFVLTIFAIFASVIYLLFALLLLVRIVMLWILVILSPVAFATKVLPESKYFLKIFPRICTWDGWWDDFLQWCFLGIPAAGTIFLSNLIMFQIATDSSQIINPPTGNVLNGTLGLLFAYLIPFIVLILGFFITLDSGGPVGGKIKGLANKAIGTTKGVIGGAAIGAAVGAGSGISNQWTQSRAEGGGRVSSAFSSAVGGAGGALRGGLKGGLTQGKSAESQINRWYTRNVKEPLGVAPAGSATQEEQKEINNLVSSYKNIEAAELQRITQQNAISVESRQEKIAGIISAVDRGEDAAITDAEINWIAANHVELRRRGADLNKIAEYAPELSLRINGQTTQQTIQGMSARKFQETVRAESLNSLDVLTHANERQIRRTIEDGSPAQVNNLRRLGGQQNQANINAHYNHLLTQMRAATTQQERDEFQRQIDNFIDNILYIQSNP